MTAPNSVFHLTGHMMGFTINETFNTLKSAKDRLEELAAAANDIAEGSALIRRIECNVFHLTDAPLPELMNVLDGKTLVRIEEQDCAKT